MTDLTSALNRILRWLESHSPASAAGFQAGLSSEIIAAKLKPFPFEIPQEIYELYQWRNGDQSYSSVFGYLWFLDIDSACEAASSEVLNDEVLLEVREQAGEPQFLFPLFAFDGEYFAVQGCQESQPESLIFHVSDCYEINPAFVNLTAMMLAIAECYETGIYVVREDDLIEVVDEKKFGEIRRKYNPGTVESLYVEGW